MSEPIDEAKLIRAACNAINSDGKSTQEQAILDLKAEVAKADPETVKSVLNEVTIEEAVAAGKTALDAGKTLYELAKKLGWIK
jgi:hypothetical protein